MNDPLTEAEVVRRFLDTSPRASAVTLIEQSARADVRSDAQVPNPSLAFQVEDSAGVRDEFLTFQQDLPISGRRGLMRRSAEASARAAGLVAQRRLQNDVYALKVSFHEVLYRQSTLERLRRATGLLDEIVEVLRRREEEGEGSGYDVLRAEQELAEVRMETARAASALTSTRSRFGSFFDPSLRMETSTLEGGPQLAEEVPSTDQAVEEALAERLDLRALVVEAEGRDLQRRAALRRRIPEPTLAGGWKRTEALDSDDTGFIATVTVPLPVFDRGQPRIAQATADVRRLELDAQILRREIRSEVLAALARERAARENAERYGLEGERRAGELRAMARLRYEEGESAILELLDAHATALVRELRSLAARYEAKWAEIERNRVIGREVNP
jgi:cobalt-zinc-cadmium efflux system outer membrane protein